LGGGHRYSRKKNNKEIKKILFHWGENSGGSKTGGKAKKAVDFGTGTKICKGVPGYTPSSVAKGRPQRAMKTTTEGRRKGSRPIEKSSAASVKDHTTTASFCVGGE